MIAFMSDTLGPDQAAPDDVARLRKQRGSLKRLTRDLMLWVGLLRHKAMSLRVLPGRPSAGAQTGLTPGSLDPRTLANELASGVTKRLPTPGPRRLPRDVSSAATDLLDEAREVWETVADPADPHACQRLSESADSLAAELEDLVDDLLDQYRKLGDELVHLLKAARPHGRASDAPDPGWAGELDQDGRSSGDL